MSTTADNRRPGRLWVTTVRRIRQVTPRVRRITVTDPELSRFRGNGTDQHIAVYFYEDGVVLPRPFTTEEARRIYPHAKPAMRRYTIREARPEACEVDLDFVLHEGDHLASGWAAAAEAGDELIWFGPTPAYAVDAEAPAFLLVGDETAVPAIACILDELADAAPARVHIEVEGPEEEQELPVGARTSVRWVHRRGGRPGEALWRSVTGDPRPEAGTKVWGGAERDVMARLRRRAVADWGLPRSDVHLTAYWTLNRKQDADRDL